MQSNVWKKYQLRAPDKRDIEDSSKINFLISQRKYVVISQSLERGIEDDSKIKFLISQRKHMLDGSNGGSQNIFYGKIWLIITKLSLLPLLIWRTANRE